MKKNQDDFTISSFGEEWSKYDQIHLSHLESNSIFNDYFHIFPFNLLNKSSTGFDMGCGSGRWAHHIAPLVDILHCIDPSSAIDIAKKNLRCHSNIVFHQATFEEVLLQPESQDFGYCLGVLHHVPDTAAALRKCTSFLKPGAPFLLYLYYNLDNRAISYRLIWRATDLIRRYICHLPSRPKSLATDTLALLVYFPLARLSYLLKKIRIDYSWIPLSYYNDKSFFTMRTDSRDRFGTPVEHRYSRDQIVEMCHAADLHNLNFSDKAPYWCVVGYKKDTSSI